MSSQTPSFESWEEASARALAKQMCRVGQWEGKQRPLTIEEQRSAIFICTIGWSFRWIGIIVQRFCRVCVGGWRGVLRVVSDDRYRI